GRTGGGGPRQVGPDHEGAGHGGPGGDGAQGADDVRTGRGAGALAEAGRDQGGVAGQRLDHLLALGVARPVVGDGDGVSDRVALVHPAGGGQGDGQVGLGLDRAEGGGGVVGADGVRGGAGDQ